MHKHYGAFPALRGVSLAVPPGAFHVLLGPSGSGKTTLLRVVAGFTAADAGRVRLAGADITATPPERRNIGVVFQNYALFPHMTAGENVAFGLRMRGVTRAEQRTRVAAALSLVRLESLAHRRPAELSGGQQQRVALARALVIRPGLLLLDEPLSALDRKIRQDLREELKRIQSQTGVTTLMVTHDQEEALYLADRVLVLDGGVLRQAGAPAEIYRHPADAFVAGFLGSINLINADLSRTGAVPVLRIAGQTIALPAGVAADRPAGPVRLAARPEQLRVVPEEKAPPASDGIAGTLLAVEFAGPVVTLRVGVGESVLSALALSPDIGDDSAWRPGRPVRVHVRAGRLLGASEDGDG